MASPLSFRIDARCGAARTGVVTTPHGDFDTPAFMPVGTRASVKALVPEQIRATGSQVVLANTYHLHLRPGEAVVRALGGLHGFMQWDGPILTDSGGYQVYSLAARRVVTDEGVRFRSHLDGKEITIGPERAIEIQNALGADIIMAFDECPPTDGTKEQIEGAVGRTLAWIERCVDAHARPDDQALFGIVQGGLDPEMRAGCAQKLAALDLPGYAIGGLALGEGHDAFAATVGATTPHLPEDRPRYVMGVGPPEDVLAAIGHGVDMFDCVLPTRNARNAYVFTTTGPLRMRNARFREDDGPPDPSCKCYTCSKFSLGYLRHLFLADEPLAMTLATIHNLTFYQELFAGCRVAIKAGEFSSFASRFLDRLDGGGFAVS